MEYHYKKKKGIEFSQQEIYELIKSLLAIGLAFAIARSGANLFSLSFGIILLISILTVGIGFLLHELAHKAAAQRFGCWSEYRSNNFMLIFTVMLSFTGIVFAAPGAVMISGRLTKRENGIVSAAGPLTNIMLGLAFLAGTLFFKEGILGLFVSSGLMINSWIALFNLIPFMNLDGRKVLAWDKRAYFIMAAAAVMLLFVSFA